MFQYALAYSLARRNGSTPACDLRFLNEFNAAKPPGYMPRDLEIDSYGIRIATAPKAALAKTLMLANSYRSRSKLSRILDAIGWCTLVERKRSFEPRVLARRDSTLYLDGYWQSQQYFVDNRDEIRKLFALPRSHAALQSLPTLSAAATEGVVCINVRRTDFVQSVEHDCLPVDYHLRALQKIEAEVGKRLQPYVFSDDIRWCRANLSFLHDPVFIQFHPGLHASAAYLECMRQFQYFVIPNSTFAWWAAWLADEANKIVVAPSRWSGSLAPKAVDIVPPDWLTM
jgi:hypothetical protein